MSNIKPNNTLNEETLLKAIPQHVLHAIAYDSYFCSLENNSAFPNVYNTPFLVKMSNSYFKEITENLKEIGEIPNVKSNNLTEALAELIYKCKKIEAPYRPQLETICANIIIDLFDIPEDSIDMELNLVDKIDMKGKNIPTTPVYNDGIEAENIDEIIDFGKEVHKRQILNTLSYGAAMDISSKIDLYCDEISKINPELCVMYKQIMLINNYLLFTEEFALHITDKDNKQMGIVEVMLGNQDERVKIISQAEIFPVLLCETLKGFFELFASHGLPNDINIAKEIINQTDFIKTNPWDMMFGKPLWSIIINSLDDIYYNELPYLFKRISTLKIDKFNELMKEVFAKTNKGKKIMSFILQKSKDDMEYDAFVEKMKGKSIKNIITDDFIHPYEL
jgi:hypothetical protein